MDKEVVEAGVGTTEGVTVTITEPVVAEAIGVTIVVVETPVVDSPVVVITDVRVISSVVVLVK